MKSPRLYIYIFFAGALALLGSGLWGMMSTQADETPAGERALPVAAIKISVQDSYTQTRSFTGRIAARRTADLSFENPGLIAGILVEEGATVRAGQTLARLDTDRLEARLAELQANLAESQANLELANRTLARQRELNEAGHVSDQRLDEAIANRATLQASVARVEASIATIKVDLENARLIAPFDGTIDRRLLDEGAVVNAGTPVLSILEDRAMEVSVGMPISFARKLANGEPFRLMTEDDRPLNGSVKTVTPAIRGQTRTALATFTLAEATDLADGELISVILADEVRETGFWVPVRAMTADVRGLWRLYRVVEDDQGIQHVAFENVQILYAEDDRAFVTGTVPDGSLIIEGGLARVVPGKVIEVVKVGGRQIAAAN